jgi:vitamin B12 transporter
MQMRSDAGLRADRQRGVSAHQRPPLAWVTSGILWGSIALVPATSLAQGSPSAAAPGALPVVVAPKLLEFVEAERPPGASPAEVVVVPVIVGVAVDGSVVDAQVVASQGEGFDEAAEAAVRRFRFRPAMRDGIAVAAKIRYDYSFAPHPTSSAVDLATPSGHEPTTPALAPAGVPEPTPVPSLVPTEPAQITVKGQKVADRLRRSAEAVQLVDTTQAKREGADMGEVLSRQQGMGVRRSGGLGSSARFSLNGLTDDQIRFFVDGIPLDFAGYGLGISVVPLGLVDRVEVYRGVVPIRFGADALGGAVNLAGEQRSPGTHASASYQVGSFGTYRLTGGARHRHANGLFASASGFVDDAKNDYPIDVEVPDARGKPQPVRVRRFHDRYKAAGGNLEVGVLGRPWARRLLLRAFGTTYSKDLQHNVNMTVPYGEVRARESAYGSTLRYEVDVLEDLSISVVVGYSKRTMGFKDASRFNYDWFGRTTFERRLPVGELGGPTTDAIFWEHQGLARVGAEYRLAEDHKLQFIAAPGYSTRTGEQRLHADSTRLDPLTSSRGLLTAIAGLEYRLQANERRLENVAFVKDYFYRMTIDQVATIENTYRELESSSNTQGIGDSLSYRFADWVWAKASYEYATRLPRADEAFGNGGSLVENLQLAPERSHNANLGLSVARSVGRAGSIRGELNGFLRRVSDMILLLPAAGGNYSRYENVFSMHSRGVDASAGWTSPSDYVAVDGNVTWMDLRNASTDGPFSRYDGDRIPNRPWLLANASARLQVAGVNAATDELSLFWNTRYVHEFLPSWESVGRADSKRKVPAQLLHATGISYLVRGTCTVTTTVEVQNLTNARAFDYLGVQKPGRAFFFKGTLEY